MSIAIILPVIPVVAIQLSGGYGLTIYGYYFCRSLNSNDMFYAVIVPIDAMLIAGTVLLIIIAWNVANVVGANIARKYRPSPYFRQLIKYTNVLTIALAYHIKCGCKLLKSYA